MYRGNVDLSTLAEEGSSQNMFYALSGGYMI